MRTLMLTALLSGAAFGINPSPQPAPLQASEPFPDAFEQLVLPGSMGTSGQDYSVLDLLGEYGRITGQTIVMSSEARGIFAAVQVGLLEDVTVPAANVHSFVGGLLYNSGVLLTMVHEEGPRVLSAHSATQGAERSVIKSRARMVDVEELELWAEQGALLLSTIVTLPHMDVRQLSTSLRPLVPDQATQSMLNAGSSNSLVITAPATQLVALVNMFERMEAAEAAAQSAQVAQQSGGTNQDSPDDR